MAICLDTIDKLHSIIKSGDLLNKKIVSLGDHTPHFNNNPAEKNKIPPKLLKKWGLPKDINDNHADTRQTLKRIVMSLGYDDILFLDNYDDETIDFRIDLGEKNSTRSISQKFGVAIDNGTSSYVTATFNVLQNVSDLVDESGYIISVIDILSFNRFPLLPAPETLIDLMLVNKMTCEKMELMFWQSGNKLSKFRPYPINFKRKQFYIFECLSRIEFIKYLRFIILNYLLGERVEIGDIQMEDYRKHKSDNFTQIKRTHHAAHEALIGIATNPKTSLKSIVKSILIKMRLMDNVRKLRYGMSIDRNKGLIELYTVFRKDSSIELAKAHSSSLHYEMRWVINE